MKVMIVIAILLALVPGCCWSGRIPKCNTCQKCNTRQPKPLDYSYDDTQYNDEMI